MSTRNEMLIEALVPAMRSRLRKFGSALETGRAPDLTSCVTEELAIVDEARRSSAQDPLLQLADRLDLSRTEQLTLWLLLSHELDPLARRQLREINTEQQPDVTLDTLRRVVYTDDRHCSARELSGEGALLKAGLIERTDADVRCPDYRQTFSVSHRVIALAMGDQQVDPEIANLASIHAPAATLDLLVAPDSVRDGLRAAVLRRDDFIILCGPPGVGKRSLVHAVARASQLEILELDCSRLSQDYETAQRQLRIVARECRLYRRTLLARNIDALLGSTERVDRFDILEREFAGLLFGTSSQRVARRWHRTPVVFDLPKPKGSDLAALWRRAIPEASAEDAELMATMYPLAPSLIVVTGDAARVVAGSETMSPEHIEGAIRMVLDDRLAGLAGRVHVTQSWNDLVLPPDQLVSLLELLARIRQRRTVYEDWGFAEKVGRGLGVSALFAGPPGTGKTMAAGLVANELGLSLYQVDLSKIVSKFIGETERNLGSLFDAAEAGHAMLLFDEADALFGKRTEVKSSNDRHANQEVNYLLQRLEVFSGVCILTSNHESAIDEAFRRRLSLHLRFPVPDVAERRKLWAAMLPQNAPLSGDLRLDRLAEAYAMTGGYIRNAVLRAAFLAADGGNKIDASLLSKAAHIEYENMGKIAPQSLP